MGATRLGANTKLPLDYEAQQKAEGTGPASASWGFRAGDAEVTARFFFSGGQL